MKVRPVHVIDRTKIKIKNIFSCLLLKVLYTLFESVLVPFVNTLFTNTFKLIFLKLVGH